ncbi:MAG: glutathione S-transferase N-terminal domain-containing protein [Rhodospirillaceae bacterium]|nr:glutathione S-transferase N-terminal domain-containing protein [Rhodospirillaceae bacterium]
MIRLLGMSSPNVQKVHLMLEEVELPFAVERIDVWKGENFAPAFAALNPNRKVPVLIDDEGPDGNPCTVFESGAILIYLAEKTGRFLARGGAARYAQLQWLAVQLSGVGPMFGQYTHFRLFAPGHDYAENRYRTQAARVFEALDERLGQAAYLGGGDYSIADIATFPWTRDRTGKWGGNWDTYPNVRRWFAAVAGRPAARRMMAEMDKIWAADRTSMADAPTELVDKILGRGDFTAPPRV